MTLFFFFARNKFNKNMVSAATFYLVPLSWRSETTKTKKWGWGGVSKTPNIKQQNNFQALGGVDFVAEN